MKILFPERIEEFSRKHAIRFIGTHSEYDKIKDIKKYIGYGYQGRKRVQSLLMLSTSSIVPTQRIWQ